LLDVAARQWPFALCSDVPPACATPLFSVIVPVAGRDRIPQFEAVLKGLFAQSLRQFEVIIVEHSSAPEYAAHCPRGVRYIHLQRGAGDAFNKSRAFNTGARSAAGRLLLLHDADVLVPLDYLRSIVERLQDRYDGLKPVRFIFYPSAVDSTETIQSSPVRLPRQVARVEQNNPGISTAATRAAYWAIGGHDERFEERGGDDNDFLDRLKTTRFFDGGFLPAIHLWHPTDPTLENSPRMKAFKSAQLRKPASLRIAELTVPHP
jgi:glycosyltransferase involved in cell wall biosynthesis